jgi:hypothetical protein
VKYPNFKTLLFILNEIFGYAAAGVLGFYIGCVGGIVIVFGLGLQHPNRHIPVWVSIIAWPVYIVPIIFCIAFRYFLTRRRNRKLQRQHDQFSTSKLKR